MTAARLARLAMHVLTVTSSGAWACSGLTNAGNNMVEDYLLRIHCCLLLLLPLRVGSAVLLLHTTLRMGTGCNTNTPPGYICYFDAHKD
jgi:hypothetical protein